MDASVIRARLDLVINLIDTTTGAAVNEMNVRFMKDGCPVRPEPRGDGNFIFINSGRENCLMHIEVYGYESTDLEINYETMDEQIPTSYVFLMPSEKTATGESVFGISGKLTSLESIEGIYLRKPVASYSEYNLKKNIMSLFGFVPGMEVRLDQIFYGILNDDGNGYEIFEVVGSPGPQKVNVRDPIPESVKANQKIYRRIFGKADKEGNFKFLIRDDATVLEYVLRFVVDGQVYFRKIDFRNTYGEIDLMDGAVRAVEEPGPEESEDKDPKADQKAKEPGKDKN
ncbi:MAG: hypothetical protein K6F99_04040 [Lachnospiraceae bacterium]|nr:hypothetical protein [Lachnospiraceae bacterium]